MSADSPVAILYDADGNPVSIINDSGVRRVGTLGKVLNAAGTQVNPATEDTLATRASEATLATRASEATLATRASEATLATRASETTLLAADGRLTTIDAVLDAIKDTDGVKKIVDALPAGTNNIGDVDLASSIPAGTNEIGKVAQGTRAAAGGGWPEYIVDASGNVVGVVLDGAIYRLQADAKVAKGATALVHLDAIDTVAGQGRLKSTLYTQGGDPVSFPSTSNAIKNEFVLNGVSDALLVDGSVTPVEFTYASHSTYDISLQELRFTLVSNAITFGSNAFGATAGPLTNGVLVQITTEYGTLTLYTLKQNEGFVNFASPGGFEWVVSSKDMMTSAYLIGGGLILRHGTGDNVKITVRDDIDACGVYFKCFVKGNLLGA